jgi:formylglycine-generating enzyme required for sulfatase activity
MVLTSFLLFSVTARGADGKSGGQQFSLAGPTGETKPRAAEKPVVMPPAPSAKQGAANAAKAGLQFVTIPGGEYSMGTDEDGWDAAKPVHRVKIKDFELTKSHVTNKQYKACVAAGACEPHHVNDGTCWMLDGNRKGNGDMWVQKNIPKEFLGDDQPIICVNWYEAKAYSQWVGGRLPSESEWEYAARSGGKDQKYPWGNEEATCERAVMDDGGNGCGHAGTIPVCSKPKGLTAQGLCDMAGSNWEWTEDWLHDSYVGAPADGSAWVKPAGIMRVGRGGSWNDYSQFLRSSFRNAGYPTDRCAAGGFRVARDRPASSPAPVKVTSL